MPVKGNRFTRHHNFASCSYDYGKHELKAQNHRLHWHLPFCGACAVQGKWRCNEHPDIISDSKNTPAQCCRPMLSCAVRKSVSEPGTAKFAKCLPCRWKKEREANGLDQSSHIDG
ncbi:MAG: hypothetical protein OXC62_05815, partial [Aestuariivita sp.]|nr:hypothetical protein [Aestuariivita sp.]